MSDPLPDHYATLGLPRTASTRQVKAAFYVLAKGCHPDRHPHDPEAESRFKEIAAAYGVLSDPQRRASYDRIYVPSGRRKAASVPAPPARSEADPSGYDSYDWMPYSREEMVRHAEQVYRRIRRDRMIGIACLTLGLVLIFVPALDPLRSVTFSAGRHGDIRPIPALLLVTGLYHLFIKPDLRRWM